MPRYFNLASPCNSTDHYMINSFKRGGELNIGTEILKLIEQKHILSFTQQNKAGRLPSFGKLLTELISRNIIYLQYCFAGNEKYNRL